MPHRQQEAALCMNIIAAMALAVVVPMEAFVMPDASRSRRALAMEAIASPDQIKLDFLGSLGNAYDLNPKNAASALFLSCLVKQATPETITRDMVESFEQLATGKWRIVYVEDLSTSFGFGSLFDDITASEVELGNDGSIESTIQCSNPTRPYQYQLSLEGSYGTARNKLLIKVNNLQSTRAEQQREGTDDTLLSELRGLPASITQSILETNWGTIFSGLVIIDIAFIDDNLAVFDLDLLARVKGKRICARKEPDFF